MLASHVMRRCCVMFAALALTSASVHAEEPIAQISSAEPAPVRTISTARRIAAIAAALGPGLIVRGLGSRIVYERRAANRLLVTEGAALLAAAVGVVAVAGTGGNEYTIVPSVPVIFLGTGAFFSSWFADIYVAAGGTRAELPLSRPPWRLDVGTAWQHDAYRERVFARTAGRFDVGRVGLAAAGFLDTGGEASLVEGNLHVRLIGAPSTGEPTPYGHRLDVRFGVRRHQDRPDDVDQLVGELEISGRLDFGAVDRALAGSFGELAAGMGLARIEYAAARTDVDTILLAGFAFGAYLGQRGEARFFYDHRRDGLVGGLPAKTLAGFVGSVGASIYVRVLGPWEVIGELQVGNAWLTTFGIGYRGGPR